MKPFATVALALVLSGCAAVGGPAPIKSPFDAGETAARLRPGPNTVTGSAMLRQVGGTVVTCAGIPVYLYPATDYAKERMYVLYGDGRYRSIYSPTPQFEPNPPEFTNLTRQTICNPQGFFKFDNLADGEYIVNTTVTWGTPPYGVRTGGHLVGTAIVRGGQTVELTLSSSQ